MELKINNEAWDSYEQQFAIHQINFSPFTNGGEFTAKLISLLMCNKEHDKNNKGRSESL